MTMTQIPSLILRDPSLAIANSIRDGNKSMIGKLALLNFLMLGAYGVLLGIQNGPIQAALSAVKLPVLFLFTMLICFPTMHVISLLLGGKHSLEQLISLFLVALTGTSVILLGFAPISLFFLITSESYGFYTLLNFCTIGISAIFGMRLLAKGMDVLNSGEEDPGVESRKKLFKAWILLYAFVGCQLSWTMRPFVGSPNNPTVVFRQDKTNFYSNLGKLFVSQFE
jgi:hypothetical protein